MKFGFVAVEADFEVFGTGAPVCGWHGGGIREGVCLDGCAQQVHPARFALAGLSAQECRERILTLLSLRSEFSTASRSSKACIRWVRSRSSLSARAPRSTSTQTSASSRLFRFSLKEGRRSRIGFTCCSKSRRSAPRHSDAGLPAVVSVLTIINGNCPLGFPPQPL